MWSIGKTVLVGTTPGRVLILRPPVDHTDSILIPHDGLEEWVVKDWDEMNEVSEYLRLEGGQDFDWVWLDSISLWQDVGLDDIWEATKERNPERNAKHAGIDKGEYGRNMDRLKQWIRGVVGLDSFNFGFTAHPTEKLNDPSGERKMMPWIQGKGMSTGICGYMNIVAYYEVKHRESGAVRVLHTESTEDFYCKNQYAPPGKPWNPLENPEMSDLLKGIEAARKTRAGKGEGRSRPKPGSSTRGRSRPAAKGA